MNFWKIEEIQENSKCFYSIFLLLNFAFIPKPHKLYILIVTMHLCMIPDYEFILKLIIIRMKFKYISFIRHFRLCLNRFCIISNIFTPSNAKIIMKLSNEIQQYHICQSVETKSKFPSNMCRECDNGMGYKYVIGRHVIC